MRTTRPLSITLPHDMVDLVKSKVTSGAYASESEVIREGLRALQERDAAVERWLRQEVVPVYDHVVSDRAKTIPVEKVFANLESRYKARKARAKSKK